MEATIHRPRCRLWQRDLINYFAEEIKTLPPAIAPEPLFEKVRTGLPLITLLNRAPENRLEDAKALHTQARLNRQRRG